MRKAAVVLGGLVLGAGLLLAQPGQDPWWRPLNPGGGSYGVTVGTVLPSLATVGMNPAPAELAVDTNAAPDGGPWLYIWDHVNAEWDVMLTSDLAGTLTVNRLIKATATGFGESTVSDNTVDIVAGAGRLTVGAAVGGVSSILIDGTQAAIIAEGTADDFELQITFADVAADRIFGIPDYGADVSPFASVGGVIVGNPNCVWADNNAIVFEGATANAFENRLETVDVGQLQAVTISDIGQAAGSLVMSVIDGGLWDVGDAGAIWFDANTIWFEGATADGNENRIISSDPGAGGATYQLPASPSDTYAFLVSYYEGNVPQGANSIWANIGEIVMEGTGANDFEIRIMADIVGVDSIIEFASPIAGASSNLMRILTDLTTVPMDNADIVNGLSIEITNANHAGAGNALNGINIATIVGDAQATERALYFNTGWDAEIASAGNVRIFASTETSFVPAIGSAGVVVVRHSGTNVNTFEITPASAIAPSRSALLLYGTASAMDGNDTVRMMFIDPTNANFTGANNWFWGMEIDDIAAEDAEGYEGALFLDTGWDAHIVFQSTTAASAENPPAGAVGFTVDDNADYSGGGGNDCASYYRTSTGTVVLGTVIILNGPCP